MDMKSMNPLMKQTLSLLLAVAIVMTSAVVPGMGGDAWANLVEENGTIYVDMLNGEYTKGELYTVLSTKWPGAINSTLMKGYYYGNKLTNVTSGSDTASANLEHGKTYTVWKTTKSGWAAEQTEVGSFTARTYYVPAVTVTMPPEMTADEGQVVVTGTAGGRVYRTDSGNNAVITIKQISGYDATVSINEVSSPAPAAQNGVHTVEASLGKDAAIVVTYVAEETKSQVNFSNNSGGSVSGTFTTGKYVKGNYTFTATPNEAKYYVDTIMVNGVDAVANETAVFDSATRAYSYTLAVDGAADSTYNVVVNFAEKKITAVNKNIGLNPLNSFDSQIDAIKHEIFNKVITESKPEGLISYEDAKISYKSTRAYSNDKWREDFAFVAPTGISNALHEDFEYSEFPKKVGESVDIQIEWAEKGKYGKVFAYATITLEDSRFVQEATLSVGQTEANAIDFADFENDKDLLLAYIKDNVTATGDTEAGTTVKSVALKNEADLGNIAAGTSAPITFVVTMEETTAHQGGTDEVVAYIYSPVKPATYNIVVVGNGTATLAGEVSGTLAGGKYTLVADPADNYYVESIKVEAAAADTDAVSGYLDVDVSSGKYQNCVYTEDGFALASGMTHTITVTFADAIPTVKAGSIDWNYYYKGSDKLDELKTKVLAATVTDAKGRTYTNDDITLSVWAESTSSWYRWGQDGALGWGEAELANAAFNGSSEKFRITFPGDNRYPAVTVSDIMVSVKETRPYADITMSDLGVVEFDNADEILTAVQNAVKTDRGSVTVALSGTAPSTTMDGIKQTVTYTATVAASETVLKTSKTFTVEVIGKIHSAKITKSFGSEGVVSLTDSEGNIVGSTYVVTPGQAEETLTVTAKPVAPGYYVESVTVNGNDVTGSFDGQTFTGTFAVSNGDAGEEKEYAVKVTYALRKLEINSNIAAVYFNPLVDFEAQKTEFFGNVRFNAVNTGACEPAGTMELTDVTVELVGKTVPTLGMNEFVLTWDATDKYPAVSETVTVEVTDARGEAIIQANNVTERVTVDGNFDAVIEAVKAAGVTVSEGAAAPTFAVKAGETVPLQGQEKDIIVVVSVAENANYLEASREVVVPVKGTVHPAELTVKITGNGSITAADGSGLKSEYFAGELEFKAAPNGAYYVDYIEVDGQRVDMTQVDGTISFTAKAAIADGSGHAADYAVPGHEIHVVFTERTASVADGPYTIKLNKHSSMKPSAQLESIKQQILAVLTPSADPDGDYVIEFYNSGVNLPLVGTVAAGWIEMKEGLINEGVLDLVFNDTSERIRVRFPATDKYPEVTVEATVTVADSREASTLNNASFEVSTVDASTVDLAWIKERYENETYNPDSRPLVYSEPTVVTDQENMKATITYTVSVAETTEYLGTSAVITVDVTLLDPQCWIKEGSNDDAKGIISRGSVVLNETAAELEAGEITVKAVPVSGYYVESMSVTDGTTEVESSLLWKDGTAYLTFMSDGSEGGRTYEISAAYDEAEFVFKDEADRTVEFMAGVELPDEGVLYDGVAVSPARADDSNVEITYEYKAREAGTYSIYIPKLAAYGITIYEGGDYEFEQNELWLKPGAAIEEVDTVKLVSDLEAMFADIKNLSDALKVADYAKELLEKLPNMHIGAHAFGELGEGSIETIRVSYNGDKYVIGSAETTVTIADPREKTAIVGNNNIEITYGYTEAQLRAALNMQVLDESGEAVSDAEVTFTGSYLNLDASENVYTIKVKYAGTEKVDGYQPASAVFTVKVNKAPCSIDYDSQIVEYGSDFTFELVKNPADVDTIDFVIGLDIHALSLSNENLNPAAYIHVKLPGVLGSYFDGETTLGELRETLTNLANASDSILGALGIDGSTIDQLLTALESVTGMGEGWEDTLIKINGDTMTPENIGVYLAGAVVSDSNYETAFTVDYLVITPKTTEAELHFNFDDVSGLIMQNLIKDGIYDLGAYATLDGVKSNSATGQIEHLFLRLNSEGEIELIHEDDTFDMDIENLSQVGAYAQLTYILDWGNELYYAVPKARAYAVINELVDVQFVNEAGEEVNTFTYTFDGNPIEQPEITVTNNLGEKESLEHVTVTYYGYTLNHPDEIYKSTTPPTDAGVYTAVAVFADEEKERYGADAAGILINIQEAALDIVNQNVTAGDDYDLGITVTPSDAKYVSIVAGVDAGGDISAEDMNPFAGAVNVDFPARVDRYLKTLVPEWYENGVYASDLLAEADRLKVYMESLDIEADVIDTVMGVINDIPAEKLDIAKITFIDGFVPKNIGLYAVGAALCDPNYTLDADFGYLIIQPDVAEVELAFNYNPEDFIFTLNYLENGIVDLGTHVVVNEDAGITAEIAAEAEKSLHNLYIGVDLNGEFTVSAEPIHEHGAYTQMAFLLDVGNEIYYAEPVLRAYAIVPESVDVDFVGEPNADGVYEFVYDGQPQDMEVILTEISGSGIITDREHLEIRYIGVDAKGIEFYNDTVAPTNVGAYAVTAVYADEESDLYGLAIGAMLIKPAPATLEVPDAEAEYNENFFFEVVTDPEGLEYMTIVGGVALTGANLMVDGVEGAEAVINLDMPEFLDNLLKDKMEEAYTAGIPVEEFKADIKEYLGGMLGSFTEELPIDQTLIDTILTHVDSLVDAAETVNVVVTFKETEELKPVHTGVYLVAAISTDINHDIVYDTGMITVMPDTKMAELFWNVEIPVGELSGEPEIIVGTEFDFGAYAVGSDGVQLDESTVIHVFEGTTDAGETYSGSEAPTEPGTYKQTSMVVSVGDDTYASLPMEREFSIVLDAEDPGEEPGGGEEPDEPGNLKTAEIEISGNRFTYNGKRQTPTAVLIDAETGEEIDAELIIHYEGRSVDYDSTEAPVNAGRYMMTVAFAGNDEYAAIDEENAAGRLFQIQQVSLYVTIDSQQKDADQDDPVFTYTITDGLVDGDTVVLELVREEGEEPGTYIITVSEDSMSNYPNYKFIVTDGELVIKDALLLGDVDLDGDVDAYDLTMLARHVAEIEIITNDASLKNGNVNMDGQVDAKDLTKMARYVAEIITSWDQE